MLYIFTKSTKAAGGSRHRGFLVAEFLEKAGHEVKLIIPPIYHTDKSRKETRLEYLKTIFSLRRGDIAFLQNPIFSKYFLICIYISKIIFRPTIVFDFDDATWVQNPIAPRLLALISDKFVVASHYLMKWSWIRNKPTLLMPNLVDFDVARTYGKKSYESTPVVLGWIGGGPESMNNLRLLVPIFNILKGKISSEKWVFKLVGSLYSDELKKTFTSLGIETQFVDELEWGKTGEIQKANASFDIGLCPLTNNISNQARCSLKVIDYMAVGLPVVMSPIGENNYFVTDGFEGFLPKNDTEWAEKLALLIQDAELRQKMGQAAREKVQREYCYQANIQRYVDFLNIKNL